jgi:hypothetical protein
MRDKYESNKEALQILDMEISEMEMHKRFSKFYGYVFYVMKKPKF